MPLLFAVTMFLSATLLFLVQPMVAKMTLPLLGGTPAVWNTCMVFFQALLLLGYLYAHKLTKDRPFKSQVGLHYTVLVLAIGAMLLGAIISDKHSPIPIIKSLAPKGDEIPFFNVIVVLSTAVALPFLVLSTSAPLLQKWFTETGHPSARDPYFLYGASNFGSLLALVGYPFVVEPYLTVVQQAYVWAIGYVCLVGLIFCCGWAVKSAKVTLEEKAKYASKPKVSSLASEASDGQSPTWLIRLRWLGLSFVPSSLMCGVTTFITTDIASLPLLWVIPLALYLITFIIAFNRLPTWFYTLITLFAPVMILLMFFILFAQKPESFLGTIAIHLAVFFITSLCCHCELARLRPKNTRYLTNFYLTMSVGGVLGGLFNALFAPLVFTYVSEYPLTMIIACLLLPKLVRPDEPDKLELQDLVFPIALFGATLMAFEYFYDNTLLRRSWFVKQWLFETADGNVKDYSRMARSILFYGFPIMACYLFVERPIRFGLALMGVWLAFSLFETRKDARLVKESGLPPTVLTRSFFGTLKVEVSTGEPEYIRLVHGTTLHGKQFRDDNLWLGWAAPTVLIASPWEAAVHMAGLLPELDPRELRPLTYYHRTGPVGFIMKALRERQKADPNTNTDMACIGLGTGSLSAYSQPGQNITFFEIDPIVRRLVEPGQYFNYVLKAKERGANVEFQMGDARLTLERLERKFAVMFVDAFSSDSIPVHLLTKQALEIYFDHLREDGLLAVHISNRYLDLEPVVKKLAEALGVECRIMHDGEDAPGKTGSSWILLTRKLEYMGPVILDTQRPNGEHIWEPLDMNKRNVSVWTDDYSPVIPILKMSLKLWGK
ncbi:hypothetical protein KIH39_21640 [Telmatocola sphagniphila]|uniref:Ferrichrome ABC transporter permease n=1 Tax=Telmatocola sphagniphila TaxID=1123043 RepID=A0A8E6B3T0_9BACT|nr:hypothetical protein [Telmatocola sphagniphila]QVL31423.1 hypothetical protein KIH39_21640 [Telmatocola sphagniphila]